ncbi:MAG: BACON domain-containing protein [Deltaproteobacteria bacterium]|nr:BACON domain-containing protein [Deltaproteobacteria bacterium]
MKIWTKMWLFALMYLFVAGVASAANPTIYTSLGGDYGRAGQADVHGNYIINNIYKSGYIQYFRVFVPPGATLISLEILEWGGQSAIARHGIPPTSAFGRISPSSSYTLSALEAADQYYPGQVNGGRLAILSDGFAAPYLPASRAGWLYVKVDQQIGSNSYYNSVSFTVNADAYNNWYAHSGSNSDGSINWATDVEGVSQYWVTGTKPEKPVVTPINNTVWTTGTTQTITATSTGAANIYGTFTSSNDVNNPPADPRIPSARDFDISANATSLACNLASVTGGIVMYKYRFIGANSSGLSDESGAYSYTIDLRSVIPGVLTVTPTTWNVAKDTGTSTFSVLNTGTGTIPWTAQVTSGGSWLSITSGASGSNAGTITCAFDANTGSSVRTGTVRVTATGVTGSSVDVTVTQAPTPTPTEVSTLLWDGSDGSASIWDMDTSGNMSNYKLYGPYSDWAAKNYHRNSDGTGNMLWVRTDGYTSVWDTDISGNMSNYKLYGPYPDWTAKSYQRNSDGTGNMLWVRTDGYTSIWDMDISGNMSNYKLYGPYPDWTAKDYRRNSDGTGNMLWVRTDGYVSLWNLDNSGNLASYKLYGPYTGWTAQNYD